MKNHLNSFKSFGNDKGKDKHFEAQRTTLFKAFHKQPKTMLMVSIETGIRQSNICRRVAELRKQNRIKIVRKGICPISKSTGVQFLTTNPDLFPIVKPLKTKGNE